MYGSFYLFFEEEMCDDVMQVMSKLFEVAWRLGRLGNEVLSGDGSWMDGYSTC